MPAKLQPALNHTALRGDMARVATTVAIEFAASWKPLEKSKSNASATTAITDSSTRSNAVSSSIAGCDLRSSSQRKPRKKPAIHPYDSSAYSDIRICVTCRYGEDEGRSQRDLDRGVARAHPRARGTAEHGGGRAGGRGGAVRGEPATTGRIRRERADERAGQRPDDRPDGGAGPGAGRGLGIVDERQSGRHGSRAGRLVGRRIPRGRRTALRGRRTVRPGQPAG